GGGTDHPITVSGAWSPIGPNSSAPTAARSRSHRPPARNRPSRWSSRKPRLLRRPAPAGESSIIPPGFAVVGGHVAAVPHRLPLRPAEDESDLGGRVAPRAPARGRGGARSSGGEGRVHPRARGGRDHEKGHDEAGCAHARQGERR